MLNRQGNCFFVVDFKLYAFSAPLIRIATADFLAKIALPSEVHKIAQNT
jgi:hypothetical protein